MNHPEYPELPEPDQAIVPYHVDHESSDAMSLAAAEEDDPPIPAPGLYVQNNVHHVQQVQINHEENHAAELRV